MVLSRQNANNMISVFVIFIQEDFLLCHCDARKSAQCCRNLPFFSKRYGKKKRQMGEFSLSTKSYLFSSSFFSLLLATHFADLRVIKNFSLVRPYLQHRLSLVLFTHQSQESLDIKKSQPLRCYSIGSPWICGSQVSFL